MFTWSSDKCWLGPWRGQTCNFLLSPHKKTGRSQWSIVTAINRLTGWRYLPNTLLLKPQSSAPQNVTGSEVKTRPLGRCHHRKRKLEHKMRHQGHTCHERWPRKETTQSSPLWAQEQASEDTNPADTLVLYFSLQNCENTNLCCLSHPVCDAVLQQRLSVAAEYLENWPNVHQSTINNN